MDIPRKLSRPRKNASRCRITIVPRDRLLASLSVDEKERKRERGRKGGREISFFVPRIVLDLTREDDSTKRRNSRHDNPLVRAAPPPFAQKR